MLQTQNDLDTSEYRRLAEFRHQIRRFLHFSENAAREQGLEPRQHQLLLAVKGLSAGLQPTIGTIAKRLYLRHHTTVELVDRLVKLDVVRRERSMQDAREVFVRLTPKGEDLLRNLSIEHRKELDASGVQLLEALDEVVHPRGDAGAGPNPG